MNGFWKCKIENLLCNSLQLMGENGRFGVCRSKTVVGHCLLVSQDDYWEKYTKWAATHGLNSFFASIQVTV